MFVNILIQFLIQMGLTIGTIFLFGFLIALLNRIFYRNFGTKALYACYATGFIGTPVHECSHALFCLIFAHKIQEIKLFQTSSEDGTLGYVSHSYNKRNIYQRAGNFFIGIAPIICISALLYALSLLLAPGMLNSVSSDAAQMIYVSDFKTAMDYLSDIFVTIWQYMKQPLFWVFILIGIFFALHMTLSKEDIKGALSGLIIVLFVFFIIDIIIGFVKYDALLSFTSVMLKLSSVLNTCLVLSFSISVVAVIFSFILRFIFAKSFGFKK
ncbi:MAG: metalloprotease family protein [Clostridia bacterium]|nr:metalloprotease family protein [Clostridia bacterium]